MCFPIPRLGGSLANRRVATPPVVVGDSQDEAGMAVRSGKKGNKQLVLRVCAVGWGSLSF